VALFDPPEAAPIRGVSFLEFAVDADMEAKLGGWLSRFGFMRTGVHHAKAVTLYEAGGARIVLNAEPESFAQAFYRVHGVSVCNLGVSVDGARHAMARALAFGCQRFDERRGAHDAQIDSVRAPNGSLLSFVDSTSDPSLFRGGEFGSTKPPPDGPSGVDHLGLAVPKGELDSWLLFYRAVLGLSASPIQALSDPYGAVRSRALINGARTARLALNVSDSLRTETAHSVAASVGALIQQIAFRSDDLLALAATLKRLGAPILRIPENYYDHLAATTDLDAHFVDELRALNVLYDRAGEGEFLHCYSESFDGRFFFEFVQRCAGYEGYGSRNAPFRLAAQARVRLQNTPVLVL
jgi:4-hydroxyphenylpyruvate dioxygenase